MALAYTALEKLGLDQVWWVPAGNPWQKQRVITPARHRLAMLRCALQDEPRFTLEPCELLRQGPSYSIDTINGLQSRYPNVNWILLLGDDQYRALPSWFEWQSIVRQVSIAVASRYPYEPSNALPLTIPCERIAMPLDFISSTQVRQAVARGQSIEQWVPSCVAQYIEQQGLYQLPSMS